LDKEGKLQLGIAILILLLVGLYAWLADDVLADLSNQPTSVPTLPASSEETAVRQVSQTAGVPIDRLSVVDAFTIEFPLTGKILYREWVLDRGGQGHLLYEVTLDESGEPLSQGGTEDALWAAEAQAYRDKYGETVLRLTAEQRDLPVERLRLVHDVMRVYLHTGRSCWQAKVMDDGSGRVYDLAIGAQGRPLDMKALQRAEFEALRARYGKLDRELYYLLETRETDDPIPVLLWIQEVDHNEIDRRLVEKYPELEGLRVAEGRITDGKGKPVELDRSLAKRIRADYVAWQKEAHQVAAQPVFDFLRARDYDVTAFDLFPGVEAELSKGVILELNDASLPNLGTIYWGGIKAAPQLDSAAPTIRAPAVWNRGYTGVGATEPITVAVVEGGPIEPDITHGALQGKIVAANAGGSTDEHAAAVAGVIVGHHPNFPQYRGIAYGNDRVVSVDVYNSWQSIDDGLSFSLEHGAQAINFSLATTYTLHMQPEDRVLDYVARHWYPTIVVGAGNVDDTGDWSVRSPAKGYNVLTVGGFEDHNNASWSDDNMRWSSCFWDPYIDGQGGSGDREKPDVVAVGAEVTTVYTPWGDDGFRARNGTSFATPQVTGLAMLIMDRVPGLASWPSLWPETIRAIIMTSATHNIEGNSKLSHMDGAGGIDVSLADTIAANGQWATRNMVYPDDYDWDSSLGDFVWLRDTFAFSASAGDMVRAVVAWDSNPSSDFQTDGTDSLDTDLDLYVWDPDYTYPPVGYSASWDNSFEIVEFTATKTGQYTIEIYRDPYESSEDLNFLGVAWLVRPRVYLPLVLRGDTSLVEGLFNSPISTPDSLFISPISTSRPTSP